MANHKSLDLNKISSDELMDHTPVLAHPLLLNLLPYDDVIYKITGKRLTKSGDYSWNESKQKHVITINRDLNVYAFLITLLHEVAHYNVNKDKTALGRFLWKKKQKSHGIEWQNAFTQLMMPFLQAEVFPSDLTPVLVQYFKKPKASTSSDSRMVKALRKYDDVFSGVYVEDIPIEMLFKTHNGRVFIKGKKVRKRFKCVEVATKRVYLFSPVAEVYRA